MAAKKNKTPVLLTRTEQIQTALTSKQHMYFRRAKGDKFDIIPEVPSYRYVNIGDEVQIGNLSDCVVAFVSEDRKFVVVDYVKIDNNYGKPIHTPSIGCWVWYDVFLLADVKQTSFAPENNTI
ncbi:hypothetical protein M0R04_07195, partial [Candidatus Dojkabacteria bacterium]|nr:hypothetical protein [Candidatus Dojkabacteria bacterium]